MSGILVGLCVFGEHLVYTCVHACVPGAGGTGPGGDSPSCQRQALLVATDPSIPVAFPPPALRYCPPFWLWAELELGCCVCGSSSGPGPSHRGRGRRPGTKLGRSQSGVARCRHGKVGALRRQERGQAWGCCCKNTPLTCPVSRMVTGMEVPQSVLLSCPYSPSHLHCLTTRSSGGEEHHPRKPQMEPRAPA